MKHTPAACQCSFWSCGFGAEVKILLPHELFHSLAEAETPYIFDSICLGQLDDKSRMEFLNHIKSLPAWSNHPIFSQGARLDRLVPIAIHGDGAVLKRDDECFVWSWSSFFGAEGTIRDVLLFKFPIAIIHERFMTKANAPRNIVSLFYAVFCEIKRPACFLSARCEPRSRRPLLRPPRGPWDAQWLGWRLTAVSITRAFPRTAIVLR